jgi:hypothetical protein
MEIESSVGASREALPAATYALEAARMRWQPRPTCGIAPSCVSLPAVSRLPLYRRGVPGHTVPDLRRELREKER